MATKYSVRWCFEGKDSESIALLSDAVPHVSIVDFVDSLWGNCEDWQGSDTPSLRWIDCIDMDTGEIIALRTDWDEPDPDWGFNEDMGYDPYMGCYTDDC